MIGAAIGWLASRPWALKLAKWAAIVGAVCLAVLYALKRAEDVGRVAEQLEQRERAAKIRRKQDEAAANSPRDKRGILDVLRRGKF